jgi:rubredoxin
MQDQSTVSACTRCGSDLTKPRCNVCRYYNSNGRPYSGSKPRIGSKFADLGDRVSCRVCKRFLGTVETFTGRVSFYCRMCKGETVVERGIAVIRPNTPMDRLLEEMQARWESFRITKLRERGTVAVGLRFTVFQRDGFRCRYCGVSIDDGAILHADHVIPESKGGLTTLENLVTACIDCNLGKSDRLLQDVSNS